MHHSTYAAALLGLLELAVPFYGLRLSRKFGVRQIGWALVAAFLSLALVRLLGVGVTGAHAEVHLGMMLVCGVVPVLLLIGMAHVDSLCTERSRLETKLQVRQASNSPGEQASRAPRSEVMALGAAAAAQHFNRHVGVIRLYANLLMQGARDRRTAAHYRRIAEEAKRAAELGKLLLSTTPARSPRQSAVNLAQLIAQARPALRRALGPSLRLETKCPPRIPLILADAAQFGFMLDQLVRNAGEASKAGSLVAVHADVVAVVPSQARIHDGARQGQFVCVSVSDNGCGMSEEIRKQLFVPFFTTKDRIHHPGLGLPSVFAMVKNHGGWMEVESEPERGTRVRMFLPPLLAS